jgi:hypothetical protein
MATLTKKNETVVAPFYKNGVTLQFLQIDFGADVSAKLDTDTVNYSGDAARSPVAVVLDAIATTCSIEVIGTVDNTGGTGQGLRIAVAALGGAFGTDTYDGTNAESLATYLTSVIVAAPNAQGVTMSGVAVTAFAL